MLFDERKGSSSFECGDKYSMVTATGERINTICTEKSDGCAGCFMVTASAKKCMMKKFCGNIIFKRTE